MTDRFAYPHDREERNAARVRALEALLIEKGVITDQTVDKVMQTFATEMGPFNGAARDRYNGGCRPTRPAHGGSWRGRRAHARRREHAADP
jgi:hypothetical protein